VLRLVVRVRVFEDCNRPLMREGTTHGESVELGREHFGLNLCYIDFDAV